MVALSDRTIRNLINSKELIISPFDKNAVTSNGYDILTENFEFNSGEFKLITSIEKIKMPHNLIAIPFLRTTYAFKGLILSPGVIDAGFEGHLKFAIYNSSKEKIKIETKSELQRAIHLIFIKTSENTDKPFGTRKGEVNNNQ